MVLNPFYYKYLLWCTIFTKRFSVQLFCRFCVVIWFFHPRHNGQWPPTSNDFLSQIWSITFFSYLNSSEKASISLLMLSAKQGNHLVPILLRLWYHSVLYLQHSTTRLSRRRWCTIKTQWNMKVVLVTG